MTKRTDPAPSYDPENIQTNDEMNTQLADCLQPLIGHLMEDHDIDTEEAFDMLAELVNVTKRYAAHYHRLMEEGKIPADKVLTNNPLAAEVHVERERREWNKAFADRKEPS